MKLWSKVTVLLVYSFLVSDTHGFAKIVPTYGRQHPESLSSWSSSRLLVTANLENTGTPLNDEEEESNQALLSIEYCVGCRWMLKSFWMAQELLTTFEKELDGVRVLPSSNKGVFAVKFNGEQLLWDRKEQGGFPSPKGLKQIVRDLVDPELFLGHSDTAERQSTQEEGSTMTKASSMTDEEPIQPTMSNGPQPAVTITYCTGCRWLLRAAYFGQELLMTFGDEIKSVTLVPSRPPAKGGIFSIDLNGELLFDRGMEGRFPEVKEIKQMIRDRISPEKDLGHSDVKDGTESKIETGGETLDDDEAEEARKYFGVA